MMCHAHGVDSDERRLMINGLLARCRFPERGAPAVCAVSGGADSFALLLLAVAAGCQVTAVHVDHGSRVGSSEESAAVRTLAEHFGASFQDEHVVVEPGPNFESRARSARYGALPDNAMTGHTADDQAETVLLQIMRGAGLDGIAAMRADARHPILALRRSETRSLCAAFDVRPLEDPTNSDPAFRRNRVRHEVLPLLGEVADRDVVPLLTRLADHARDASEFLFDLATELDPTDAAAIGAAPPVLARVALREWLRSCSDERHPPDSATVDRVMAVARIESNATDVGGGWRVARTSGRLRLERPQR